MILRQTKKKRRFRVCRLDSCDSNSWLLWTRWWSFRTFLISWSSSRFTSRKQFKVLTFLKSGICKERQRQRDSVPLTVSQAIEQVNSVWQAHNIWFHAPELGAPDYLMGRTWPAYSHYTKRQSVQLSNKHSYQIYLFIYFPVTCYWHASHFHSIWDYKYSSDGRIVTKDKLEIILEAVIFVHARYCPELLWRDWGKRNVVTVSWPRLDSDFAIIQALDITATLTCPITVSWQGSCCVSSYGGRKEHIRRVGQITGEKHKMVDERHNSRLIENRELDLWIILKCNKIFSGWLTRQVFEWQVNRNFKERLCFRHQGNVKGQFCWYPFSPGSL
jgi:hypothetical protein